MKYEGFPRLIEDLPDLAMVMNFENNRLVQK
jgi:hypothetical protein